MCKKVIIVFFIMLILVGCNENNNELTYETTNITFGGPGNDTIKEIHISDDLIELYGNREISKSEFISVKDIVDFDGQLISETKLEPFPHPYQLHHKKSDFLVSILDDESKLHLSNGDYFMLINDFDVFIPESNVTGKYSQNGDVLEMYSRDENQALYDFLFACERYKMFTEAIGTKGENLWKDLINQRIIIRLDDNNYLYNNSSSLGTKGLTLINLESYSNTRIIWNIKQENFYQLNDSKFLIKYHRSSWETLYDSADHRIDLHDSANNSGDGLILIEFNS